EILPLQRAPQYSSFEYLVNDAVEITFKIFRFINNPLQRFHFTDEITVSFYHTVCNIHRRNHFTRLIFKMSTRRSVQTIAENDVDSQRLHKRRFPRGI